MKINPPQEATMMINSTGIGTVTKRMVRERAVELAVIDGRTAQETSKSDWEQAKREFSGESNLDANETSLEEAPESERWDPVAGSNGHVIPVVSIDDEDGEGRSFSERLVEEGMLEAEHDRMRQASRIAAKADD